MVSSHLLFSLLLPSPSLHCPPADIPSCRQPSRRPSGSLSLPPPLLAPKHPPAPHSPAPCSLGLTPLVASLPAGALPPHRRMELPHPSATHPHPGAAPPPGSAAAATPRHPRSCPLLEPTPRTCPDEITSLKPRTWNLAMFLVPGTWEQSRSHSVKT
jgi:hypothetical protein